MINFVVEGESDREAAKAVVRAAGHQIGTIRVAGGKSRLDPLIAKYSIAARQSPWVVFRDSDSDCPVELRSRLYPPQADSTRFQLRIAHSMTEAWLLADRDGFSEYFGVARSRVPEDPEALQHAKRTLISLCENSRSRTIRNDMCSPDQQAGPLFVSRLNDFASSKWSVDTARQGCDSLERAIIRIEEIVP